MAFARNLKLPFRTDLLVIQPTPFCNLACKYCYLLDKDNVERMSFDILSELIRQILDSGLIQRQATIVWHSGEPLTIPISYYRQAFKIIEELDPKRVFTHSIQTNGTTISDDWCELFLKHDVDVGVSLDGPRNIHDANRIDRKGRGSFERVMRGLQLLKQNLVRHHLICVLTKASLEAPEETLQFFVDLGVKRVGFNLEEVEGSHVWSSATQCEHLVTKFFTLAHAIHIDQANQLCIREIERAYQLIAEVSDQSGDDFINLNQQIRPFGIVSVDYRGNISTFSPELLGQTSAKYSNFLFSNITRGGVSALLNNAAFRATFQSIQAGVAACAKECEFFRFCGGGAPANKFFENGTFQSTETFFCRTSLKIPFSVALCAIEKSLDDESVPFVPN
jgi:uncharacterized protein